MNETKLNIEKELSALLNADTPEAEILNTYRKMKQEKEIKEKQETIIRNHRERVIGEILNYLTCISDHELTKEEKEGITEYINKTLKRCEEVAREAKPVPKVTKCAWRNGKELSEEEADKIIADFWKQLFD